MLYILMTLLDLHATLQQLKMTMITPQTLYPRIKGLPKIPHDITCTTRQLPVADANCNTKPSKDARPYFPTTSIMGHLFSTRCFQSCGTVSQSCLPCQNPRGYTEAIPQHVIFTCMHAPCTAAYPFSKTSDEGALERSSIRQLLLQLKR